MSINNPLMLLVTVQLLSIVTPSQSSGKEESSLVTLQTTFETFLTLNPFFPLDKKKSQDKESGESLKRN